LARAHASSCAAALPILALPALERLRRWLEPSAALPLVPLGADLVLGRDARCEVHVDDPTVSRRHAALRWCEGVWMLEDLSSTNGTWVNGRRVRTSAPVRPGDVVQLGETQLRLGYD
jgi:predicted component of type VI protein secretion system